MKWHEKLIIGSVLILVAVVPVYSAVTNETLINLQDVANTVMSPLRLQSGSDNGTNPTVKIPTTPCVATAAAPSHTEGHVTPCSMDLVGNLRTSAVFSGTIGTVAQGNRNASNAQ